MALIDRAILGAKVAFVNGKEYITGATSTPTAVTIDPIVSGSDFSYLFESGGGHSHSLTVPSLAGMSSWTAVFYIHFSSTAAATVARVGGSPLIAYDPLGFCTVTVPYSTNVVARFDTQMENATQIAIVATSGGYQVYADGSLRASGAAPTETFSALTAFSVASETNATIVLGGFCFYEKALTERELQIQFTEAFMGAPDYEMAFDSRNYEIYDSIQDYAMALSIPASTEWREFNAKNVRFGDRTLGLDLKAPEVYSTDDNSFTIPRLSDFSSSVGGSVKARFAFAATGVERCLVHLKPHSPGYDEFAVVAMSDSTLQAYRKAFMLDGNGNDISAWSFYGSPSSTVAGGTVLWPGFAWDETNFYNSNNTGNYNPIDIDFDPSNYSVTFGGTLVNTLPAINAVSYHANRAAWNWVLRVFDYSDAVTSDTEYGPHTYYTGSTEDVPVRAEGYIKIDVMVPASVTQPARKPVLYIDGKPNGTITEVVTT
jgi:hypothetical protein